MFLPLAAKQSEKSSSFSFLTSKSEYFCWFCFELCMTYDLILCPCSSQDHVCMFYLYYQEPKMCASLEIWWDTFPIAIYLLNDYLQQVVSEKLLSLSHLVTECPSYLFFFVINHLKCRSIHSNLLLSFKFGGLAGLSWCSQEGRSWRYMQVEGVAGAIWRLWCTEHLSCLLHSNI